MKNFLLIDENFNHVDLLMTNLESRFDNGILVAGNSDEANFILENREDIGVIISNCCVSKGTGKDVFNKFCDLGYNIPFVFLSEKSPQDLEQHKEFKGFLDSTMLLHRFLQKPYEINDLINLLEEVMGENADKTESKFKKVRIDKYLNTHKTSFPIHVKINEEKIVKLNQMGDSESENLLNKLQSKGVQYIYLSKEDYSLYINESFGTIAEVLKSSDFSLSEKIDAQFNSVDSFHDGLVLLGVPEQSLKLAKDSIDTTIENLQKSKGLTPLLARILSRTGYIQQISLLTNYIAVAIAKETDYADKKLYEKLSLASIFMDMSLQKSSSCEIMDVNGENFRSLDFGTRSKITSHPEESCNILEGYIEIPTDVRNMILAHHERADGSGFPRGIDSNCIKVTSAIFILAHEFSHHLILATRTREPLRDIIQKFFQEYNNGNFKKPLLGFKAVFKLVR